MPQDPLSSQDVRTLVSAVQQLSVARELPAVTDIVRRFARSLVDSDGACFVLSEGDRVFYAGEDAILPLWEGRRFPADACISGWAMHNRQVVAIEDVFADTRVPQDLYRDTFVKSLAIVPVNQAEPVAAIGVYWARRHLATPRELELLQVLADTTATAVANSELYRGLSSARSELEHAGARLRLALEAGAIGTWDLDPRAGTLIWDLKCKELFGLPADEDIDLDGFLERVHASDRPMVAAAVEAALLGRDEGRFIVQFRLAPLAGEPGRERWIAARGQVKFDAAGHPVRFVGTARDITADKLAEAEKLELLRRANEANLAKDEFLAMLGHELRNPLAPIVTAIELLKMRGHEATREVATIERQSQHLVRLVDDLLDISRVTRGLLDLKRRRAPLQTIVAKAIEIAAPLIEQRRHALEVEVAPDVLVEGDEFRLAQVLANLLTNAAKYTPDPGTIRVTAQETDASVVIQVADSGRGIAPELLPRLFAPFVQAHQSSNRSLGGLGLGLALARSIVELHGGSIEAHSPGPGQGSVFSVRLPHASRAARPSVLPRRPSPGGPRTPPQRILVVDDNEDAAELLARLLSDHGHEVRVAIDPVEALEQVRRDPFHVAFMDIGLPVMDGYELAEQMRAELEERCPVMIAVTGYGQEADRRRSSSAGFALHLVKPVQSETVLRALADLAARAPDRSQAGDA